MKAKLILLFSFIILFGPFLKVNACSCAEVPEDFCSSIDESNYVALVEITEVISYDKRTIKILENIYNEILDSEVELIGQDGINCGEFLDNFQVGDTLVVGLFPWTDNAYFLSICGKYFLNYSNGNVSQKITPDINVMPYDQFVEEINTCVELVSSDEELSVQNDLIIYPNPCKGFVEVQSDYEKIKSIAIYSVRGKLLFEQEVSAMNKVRIELEGFPQGILLIKVETDKNQIVKKVNKK